MGKWKTVEKLGMICPVRKGQSLTSSNMVEGDIPVIAGGMSYCGYHNRFNRKENTITVSASGANAGVVLFHNNKIFATDCSTIEASDKYDIKFIYYNLLNRQDKIFQLQSGLAQPHVYPKDIEALSLEFPESPSEQTKIAKILTTIDTTIEKTKALIEKHKNIKEGLLQDLLANGIDENGNIRSPKTHKYKPSELGMIPEEWDCVSVANMFKLRARIGWQGLKASEFVEDGPFVVTGTDLQNGEINWETCYHVSEFRYKQDSGIQLKNHDLVITKDGTIGKTAMVNNCPEKVTLNSGLFVVRPTNNSVMTEYLYLILSSRLFELFMKNILTGSTIKHLNQCEFYKLLYAMPNIKNLEKCLEEQKRIVDTVQSIGIKIKQEQQQLLKFQSIKKGLMQDLLTNTVSVDCLL